MLRSGIGSYIHSGSPFFIVLYSKPSFFISSTKKNLFHVCKDPRTGNLLSLQIKNRICFHFCVLAFMGRPTVAIINVVVSHDVFNSSYSDNFCRSPAFVCRGLLLPVDGYSGVQGGRGRGHGLLQPPPTCPGPTYPRPRPQQQPAPPRRATALGRGRPVPCRGNTAGANLRRLLGLGVCSCAPISGTCGTQHRGLLTTPSPGYRQETRREAAATESQSVTSGQCRSAESPSCHLPRYCRYSRHLYLHKSPPPPPPPHSASGGCWTRCPRA